MTVQQLVVVINGHVAGVIANEFSWPRFTYTDQYAHAEDTTALSVAMPKQPGHTYSHLVVGPWLAGLLPEDPRTRQQLAGQYVVDRDDAAALLAHVGRDCAGAVQVAGIDDLEDVLAGRGDLQDVTDAQIGARIHQLHTQPQTWVPPGQGWSLSGRQPKFTLTRTGDRWAVPTGDAVSTHIVKPATWPAALNEHLCQTALAAIGLPTAATQYREFDGHPAIVTTRYDRTHHAPGTPLRIHQEDLCQALSVWPHNKHPADGGPAAVSIARLLARHASQVDVDRFCDTVIARYLLGDADTHAKKYSLVLAADDAALAPLYGVSSTLADPRPRQSALPIAGITGFGQVSIRHITRFAADCGTDPERLIAAARTMAAQLPDAFTSAARAEPGVTAASGFVRQLRDQIARHCASIEPAGRRRMQAPA